MINPAKGILFAQEQFSEQFKNVTAVLPYPQYWLLRFTGRTGSESTYMGNHTYLWDQIDNTLSTVACKLGLSSLIPDKLYKSWDILGPISTEFAGKTGLSNKTIVTMGIHDSNAALLPHFAKKGNTKFMLNSTGTWCVIMNPLEKYGFAPDELGKVVFFNISAFGKPVKTAIFLGGLEFEAWSEFFKQRHGKSNLPPWNEKLYRSILAEKRLFLLPELNPGSGQFPASRARITEDGENYLYDSLVTKRDKASNPAGSNLNFSPLPFPHSGTSLNDYETSFALLRISLVMQTLTALERAGIENGCEVYTEGGFRKDKAYNLLMASALPNNRVFLTGINEASALGAAMTAKMAISGKTLADLAGDFEINYSEVEKGSFPELAAYRQAWLAEANSK